MKKKADFRAEVREMAGKARRVSRQLAQLSTAVKNKALLEMAEDLERNREASDQRKSEGSCLGWKKPSFFVIEWGRSF